MIFELSIASSNVLCPRPDCFICQRFDGAGWHEGTSTLNVHPYVTYHVTLVIHVCATAHLTKWVFGVCLGGPSKRAGHRKENGSFYGLEDKSPMGGGTTDRGWLVSRQKMAIFLPMKPCEALD